MWDELLNDPGIRRSIDGAILLGLLVMARVGPQGRH